MKISLLLFVSLIGLLLLPSFVLGLKDWDKVKDADLDKELNEFEDDDPDNPLVKGPDGNPMPRNPHKAEMAFVTFRKELAPSRKETEELSVKFERLLRTSSLEAKPYVIEDHKVLYVVQTGPMDMLKVRNFLLDQAEVWEFEWNQQKSAPSAAGSKAFRKRARELGLFGKKANKKTVGAAATVDSTKTAGDAATAQPKQEL